MRLKPCSAEERQRRGHGKLRLASVLFDALFESSLEALPILAIAVHHNYVFPLARAIPASARLKCGDSTSTLPRQGGLAH